MYSSLPKLLSEQNRLVFSGFCRGGGLAFQAGMTAELRLEESLLGRFSMFSVETGRMVYDGRQALFGGGIPRRVFSLPRA